MPKDSPISREFGENLAVQALAYLAQDPERLGVFLGLTGIGPDRIRKAAADPAFLAGVLDHVASDEQLLRAVADFAGVPPETVQRAHLALSGRWEREVP
ncbi:MAG TPA: DUF3572 domain-containing protein [Xanthobacteraceae bacterium]|nr:DUF3572 domain-containing protein [Xanthobacteraceae bacterium]